MSPIPTVQKIVCVVIIYNNDGSKSNNIVELYSYELFVATLFVASKLTHSASLVPRFQILKEGDSLGQVKLLQCLLGILLRSELFGSECYWDRMNTPV